MSYCKKCGAYIPDGQDTCLACGFDEAAEQRKQDSGTAYAYAPKSEEQKRREDEARRRAEQRRREQQEMNRKWAESEALRRKQQEDFRRSQEEAARRAAEYDAQRKTNEDGYYRIHKTTTAETGGSNVSASGSRTYAYLSYISFLCFLPALLDIKDPFTRFHARQGTKLFIASVIGWLLGLFSIGIGTAAVKVLQIILMVTGLRNVANGLMQELPIIGHFGEEQKDQQPPQDPQQK